MKTFSPDKIRNLCLAAHGGTGKTTITESILYVTGTKKRFGSVTDGTTSSDYNPDEIERKISINASLLHAEWKGHKLNIVDTPGYADFRGEVVCAMSVADLVIIPVQASPILEVGTESAWNYAMEYHKPVVFVINGLDKENADYEKTAAMLIKQFSGDRHVVEFTRPVGFGKADFSQIADVVSQKLYKFSSDKSGNYESVDLPADLKEPIAKLREALIENAAESDDQYMEHFFESGTLSDEEFQSGLRKGVMSGKIVPIFSAAAVNSIGIKLLLDFIIHYSPSPVDLSFKKAVNASGQEVLIECKTDAPFSAFVFKTISEMHVGELSLFRVYSGSVKTGDDVLNTTKNITERIGQVFLLNGKERVEVGMASAGDIAALVKLRDTHTNDTLCDKSLNITFPKSKIPEPIITFAIVPKGKTDETKISTGLHTLHEEDPSFVYYYDTETFQSVVSGQGEMHLNIVTKRLKDRFGVDVDLVDARIPYKETIKGIAKDAEYKHKKQSGGRGQYGHVHLKIEPKPRGTGFEFVDEIVGGVVPGRFIPAVEKGVVEAMGQGVIAGYPVVDVKVTLFDGTYHDVDSDELSFKLAASQAFRKGFKEAKPIILEPIYELEVRIPEEYLGAIMGDISGRRGQIQGMNADGAFQVVKALVPLAEIQKYATILRSMTSGRGAFSKKFSHYAELPADQAQKIIQEYEEKKASGEK